MARSAPGTNSAWDLFVKMVATFLGTGYFPWGPGTMGSFAGILVAWFSGPLTSAVLLIFIGLGFWACKPAVEVFQSSDPSRFVMDEACGVMIAVFLIPRTYVLYLAGFILFRFFDILKPWPISLIQKSKDPSSIMWDDLLAGIFANTLIRGYLLYAYSGAR